MRDRPESPSLAHTPLDRLRRGTCPHRGYSVSSLSAASGRHAVHSPLSAQWKIPSRDFSLNAIRPARSDTRKHASTASRTGIGDATRDPCWRADDMPRIMPHAVPLTANRPTTDYKVCDY